MKTSTFISSVVVTLAVGMAIKAPAQGRSDLALSALGIAQHVPDELIVQFKPNVSDEAKAIARGRVRATFQDVLVNAQWRQDGKGDMELVKLPPGLAIAAAVRGLEADPDIEFAEPNWVYQHQATSNDPLIGSLWGMDGDPPTSGEFGTSAIAAWDAGNVGNVSDLVYPYPDTVTVYVGIIDEGYMYAHEDLAANAGTNPKEIPGNGIDDDGNGYKDDVYGWDFAGNNNTVFDGVADDHGTHVAGTIGGVGGNGKGVAGMCWKVKLLNAKFLGNQGGTTANAIKAVDYLTDLKTRHGLRLVASNNSWGGGGFSQGLKDAIDRAGAANILFVAAAGNASSNNDGVASYPASYDNANIIAVASITSTGGLSSFSNWGLTTVDLGAPGSGIVSTVPGTSRIRGKTTIVSGYASYSGTSMATPHVTGACALYAAANPGATAAQLKAAILGTATPTPSLAGKCVTGGRLNVGP